MLKKYEIFIIFLATALLFAAATPVFALEVRYPSLPMVGSPENCEGSGCLGAYISYWFTLGIIAAALLALISFTIGAIGLINPSPEAHGNAKDRIKGSILGLVLCLSAFVLLQTINPELAKPTLTPLPGVAGIFYMKDSNNLSPAPMAEENVINNVPKGFERIYYKCDYNNSGGYDERAPHLFVWKFSKPGLEGGNNLYGSGVQVVELSCGRDTSLSGVGSFKLAYETPGIYYFLGENCSGYMSGPNTTNQNKIAEPFTGKIKSVSFSGKYGVIFHNKPVATDGSDCTIPIFSVLNKSGHCENLSDNILAGDKSTWAIDFSAFSAEIFQHPYSTDISSGDGVWFYSNVNGWDSGNKSGITYVSEDELKNYLKATGNYFNEFADKLIFDYTGVDSNQAITCSFFPACRDVDWETYDYPDCCGCASPKDWNSSDSECGGSIKIGGNYLVTLYSIYTDIKDGKTKWFCQSFTKDTPNLSTSLNSIPQEGELDNISIISTR